MLTLSVTGFGKVMYDLNGVTKILGMNKSITVPKNTISSIRIYNNEEYFLGWYDYGRLITKDHFYPGGYYTEIEARFTGTGEESEGGMLPPIEMD